MIKAGIIGSTGYAGQERAAALLKKGHCRFRREGRHGAVEEASSDAASGC